MATIRTDPFGLGKLYATDQMGIIYDVSQNAASVYLDIRKYLPLFMFEPGIGTGFGSFDFHPDFKNNGLFYTTHTENYDGKEALNSDAWVDSIGVGLQWI